MAWFTYTDSAGRGWAIDPEGVAHIFRSAHYNRLVVQRSRIVRCDQGFLLPTTTEVETNFNGIRAATADAAQTYVSQINSSLTQNPASLYEFLVRAREDGDRAGDHYQQMSRQASHATAVAINANVAGWENAITVAKVVRDLSAGTLLVGATALTGGAALAVAGAGTGLTFTGSTEDNLQSGQTLNSALRNAAVSTSVTVVTSVLIPRGLTVVGRGMVGAGQQLSMGQNVVLGLISVQTNIAGDMIKTVLTADAATTGAAQQAASQQLTRQLGARTGTEMASMLFGAWLSSRGIPATAFLRRNGDVINSVVGGALGTLGDRLVTAASQPGAGAPGPGNLDIVFTQMLRTATAEGYVREVAMRPA